jgi:hypothetical protein
MDRSVQVEAVIGAGRGALIVAMFGAGWLGWGLSKANAFHGLVGPVFGFTELSLLGCSIYTIAKGRRLRSQFLQVPGFTRRSMRRSFLLVVVLEVLALFLVSMLAYRLHRPDLAPDWCAMVVGLHFLPLAKIFRAPRLGIFGVVTKLWCLLCWALFRSNALVVAATTGTGILLWAASVSALFRARKNLQWFRR